MRESRIIYMPRSVKRRRGSSSKKGLFTFLVVGIVFACVAGGIYFARIRRLQVTKISVEGVSSLSQDEIAARIRSMLDGKYFGLVPRTNIFLIRSSRIAKELIAAVPMIRSIRITKTIPDRVTVSVVERTLWAIACNDLNISPKKPVQCAYIDDTGFAYESSPLSVGSLITRITTDMAEQHIPSAFFDGAFVADAGMMKQIVEHATSARVIGYDFSSALPREMKVKTAEGFTVIFPRGAILADTEKVLQRVFEQEIKEKQPQLDYIDVRFGNKVFFKFRGI